MRTKKETPSEKQTFITEKGLARLESELEHLKTVKRVEIAKYLQDTSDDFEETECLIAQEEQAFVEGRIKQLELLLANVKVIQPGSQCGLIDIGSTVAIRENGMDPETYTLVGSAEADPINGMISNESPLGKTLIGCKAGDEMDVRTPSGVVRYRVIAVQ
jgi:transcription elongation factor GreA